MNTTTIIASLITPITELLKRFIPDKTERDRLAHEIATMSAVQAHENAMAQIKVNEREAAHKSIFVAGSRPAILWICALALAYNTLAYPIIDIWVEMPPINTDLLSPVMMGLLGLGTLRTAERFKGVERNQ